MVMYELLYIVGSPFTKKDLPGISEKVKKAIESLKGKIVNEDNLGNKKLAYPIKRVYRGFYILVNFELPQDKLKEFNNKFNLTPEILRHMIVRIYPKPVRIRKEKLPAAKPARPSSRVPEGKEKEKKEKKVDLEKLGEKIDKLLEI